ncbi:MAG: hypothetical protein KBT35_05930, partial [Firmicutes bacterium]|nr:hypothetical protein [Candidatus Colivicinus equi]
MQNASDSAKDLVQSANGATVNINNLGNVSKASALKMTLLNTAMNIGFALLATVGIKVIGEVVKLIDENFIHALEHAQEKAKESKAKLDELTSEIESLNSELQTTKDRIRELEGKSSLTLVEEDELTKLKLQNDELEREIYLRNKAVESQGKQAAKDAEAALTTKVNQSFSDDEIENPGIAAYKQRNKVDRIDNFQDHINSANQKREELKKLEEQQKKIEEKYGNDIDKYSDDKTWKTNQDKIESHSESISQLEESMSDYYLQLSEEDDALYDSNGRLIDGFEETGDRLRNVYDSYATYIHNGKTSIEELKDYFDDVSNSYVTNKLQNLFGQYKLGIIDEKDIYSTIEFNDVLNKTGISTEQLIKHLEDLYNVQHMAGEATKYTKSQMIDAINDMSKGFNKLDEIYADVKDGDVFDFTRLNSKDFSDAFEGLEDEYTEFIEKVSSSPNDIKACQEAFDKLTQAYIEQKGILDELTEENSNVAIAMLKNMGVTNAEEIVTKKLGAQQDALANKESALVAISKDMKNGTDENTNAFLKESKMTSLAKSELADLIAKEQIFNNSGLNVYEKVAQLEQLAAAYFGVGLAVNGAMGGDSRYWNSPEDYLKANLDKWKKLLGDSIKAEDKIKFNYGGADKSNKSDSSSRGSGSSKTKETKSTIDWIQRKLEVLQKTIDLTKEKFNNLFYYTSKRKNLKEQISQVSDLLKVQSYTTSIYEKAAKLAGKKLSKSLKEKVDKGDYSIKDYGSKTQELINNYKDLSDKANDARKSVASLKAEIRSLAEQYASMPWEKAQKSIEGHEKYISLWQAQADNAVSSKDKNKYIDKIIEGRRKILKDTQDAVNKDNSNLEYDGNKVKKLLKNKKYNNGKKLSDEQKKAIRDAIKNNKRISLKGIEAGALRKWIEKYNATLKEAKEHTLDLRIATEEFISQMNELNKVKFDNIAHEYENLISLFDSRNSSLQDQISLAEAKGYQVGAAFYKAQIENNRSSLKLLEKERGELLEKMKDLVIGSDEWYDAQQKIHGIDSEITKLTQDNVELNNAIKQLDFSRFEQLQNLLSNIVKESDFLIGLMGNEDMYGDYSNMSTSQLSAINPNGIDFSKYGLATMGQHSMNYDLYMAMADNYAEEIRKLDAEYANDKNNETYLQKRQEWLEAQQSSITSAQNEKKAIIDLVKGGFDAQINALKKAIEEKKKQLQLDKEAYEFNKKVSEQKKSVADIQKQINALEGDDSEENRKKLQQLKASLKDAEETLKDTMYDKSISDQEKAMDKMLEDSENSVDEYMKDSNKVFAEAINFINSNSKTIGKTIEGVAKDVGYSISHNITDAWKDG